MLKVLLHTPLEILQEKISREEIVKRQKLKYIYNFMSGWEKL
jgi:hypothetical protein